MRNRTMRKIKIKSLINFLLLIILTGILMSPVALKKEWKVHQLSTEEDKIGVFRMTIGI